ncbi:MAG: hypothetical protein U0Q11_08615 [Vicinamibacterales bacterium]
MMRRVLAAVSALMCCAALASAQSPTPVTFSHDVAPILFAKCGVCHRPGGAGPFTLLTYASARVHATQIATLTANNVMPPWQADGDYGGEFVGRSG